MPRLTGASPVLLVADIERSVAYYRDKLGFDCAVYGHPPNFATATRDDAVILLALCTEPERIVPNWTIVDMTWNAYIRVDDADAIRVDLVERGIEVSEVDEQPWGRFVYFADPDGNRWALQQLPDWSASAGGDGDWQAAGVDPEG